MALTERYATPAGAGAHDGTSEADAWSLTEAIANVTAGVRVNLKGAFTPSTDRNFTVNGTIAAPIVWRGYATTIGDASLGRTAAGAVDTTNMPTMTITDATVEITVSATYNIFQDISFVGNSTAALLTVSGTGSEVMNCKFVNSSTGGASYGLALTGTQAMATQCDIEQTGASGGAAAVQMSGDSILTSCRIKSTSGPGVTTAAGASAVVRCVIYNCGTHGFQSTATGASAHVRISGSTIYGCASNGVDIAAGSTAITTVTGCHITDNGGYGVDANAATAKVRLINCRTRDNVSGAHLLDAEWSDAVYGAVTTDTGGAATDYADAGSLDFRLIQGAAGEDTTAMGQSIGAGGLDPDSVSSSSGGGRGRVVFLGGH